MINSINELIKGASYGVQPIVEFNFPKELTKEIILQLYKRITSSHAYTQHKAMQEYIKTHSELVPNQFQLVIKELSEEKRIRR